jgi:hypothetical protein
MLTAALEVLVGIVAVVGAFQAASLVARGYKNKQRELISKRLGQGRQDDRTTTLPVQADVEQPDESANTERSSLHG